MLASSASWWCPTCASRVDTIVAKRPDLSSRETSAIRSRLGCRAADRTGGSRVAELRQVLDDTVEQRRIATLGPLVHGDRDANWRPGPHDPARFGKLDRGVPLTQWLSQFRMQVKRSPLAGYIYGSVDTQHVQRWNRYKHRVGEPETSGCQSLSYMPQLVLKPRPGRGPDSRQTPRVVQLQWVAVAEHDWILLLQRKGLLPPPRVDLDPVGGLPVFVSTVRFSARWRVFGHDRQLLLSTPGRLAGPTWSFNGNDH
jgi:hypothetical protein